MHRKNMIPRIQPGHVVTALVLLVLASILAVSVFLFGQAQAAAAAVTGGPTRADLVTCQDYRAWAARPSVQRYKVMLNEAKRSDGWLRIDITRRLAHAEHIRDHQQAKLLIGYIAIDCSWGD